MDKNKTKAEKIADIVKGQEDSNVDLAKILMISQNVDLSDIQKCISDKCDVNCFHIFMWCRERLGEFCCRRDNFKPRTIGEIEEWLRTITVYAGTEDCKFFNELIEKEYKAATVEKPQVKKKKKKKKKKRKRKNKR